MKKCFCTFLAAVLLLSLCACGKDGADIQMIYPIDAEPEYLDPQIAEGSGSACILAACFEGLMTYDETGALVPAAAESYELSLGELVYTFHLRDDLRWRVTNTAAAVLGDAKDSFDKRVTAEDFAFGLRRALLPETNSPAAPYLMAIKNAPAVHTGEKPVEKLGVKAIDDLTLEVKLSRKDDGFLAALTLPGAMPCRQTYFEATNGRYGLSPEYFICNGPFFLSNWNSDTGITVRRERKNTDPYRSPGDVKPASVYFSFNSEQSTRDAKLQSGLYEAAPLTAAQAQALAQDKNVTVQSYDTAVFALLFNCGDPILSNSAVRRAVAMTFDVGAAAEAMGLTPAEGLIPAACLWGATPYYTQFTAPKLLHDSVKQAREVMQSGMDQLDVKDVDLTVLCGAAMETAVRTVMQQWQSSFGVHFSIAVEPVPEDELQTRLRAGDYQMAFASLNASSASALSVFLRFGSENSGNIVRLHSRKYDTYLENLAAAIYPKEATDALQSAEGYLIRQAVLVPIGTAQTYLGFAKGVSGIGTDPTGTVLYFKRAIKL